MHLLGALDALADDLQVQRPGQRDDAAHDLELGDVVFHVADEDAVDLEGIDRHAGQVGDRREAGAEVIQRNADAGLLERPEGGQDVLDVAHHVDLGEFERKCGRLHFGGFECLQDGA